jgi:hypothetical protein
MLINDANFMQKFNIIFKGIGADHTSVSSVVGWIQQALPGTYVKNVEIGNGYEIVIFLFVLFYFHFYSYSLTEIVMMILFLCI